MRTARVLAVARVSPSGRPSRPCSGPRRSVLTMRRRRRDVDDAAVCARARRQHRMGQEERRRHVDSSASRNSSAGDWAPGGSSERRVVDQDVDPAEVEGATRKRSGKPGWVTSPKYRRAVPERVGRDGGQRLITNVYDDRRRARAGARQRPHETASPRRSRSPSPLEIALARGHRKSHSPDDGWSQRLPANASPAGIATQHHLMFGSSPLGEARDLAGSRRAHGDLRILPKVTVSPAAIPSADRKIHREV